MSEIEKMYENCGIEPQYWCSYKDTWCPIRDIGKFNSKCAKTEVTKDCDARSHIAQLPKFTAEKQLAIFKIFCRRYLEVSQHVEENGDLCFGIKATVGDYAVGFNKDFAECLADFVNCLWQDLTEEEKQQVKGILE